MTITATIRPEFIVEKQGKKFVLAAGLVDAAHRAFETLSIVSEPLQMGTDANGLTWIVSTTVTCPNGTYRQWGDASPQNVSRAMLTVLPRLAETRSVSRALRLAVNAGILAIFDDPDDDARPATNGDAKNESPQSKPVTATRPNRDWTGFWVHVKGLGASPEEVHDVLHVKSVTDWPGSLEAAIKEVEYYILTRDKQPVATDGQATFEKTFPAKPATAPTPSPQPERMPTQTGRTSEARPDTRMELELAFDAIADRMEVLGKVAPLPAEVARWSDQQLAAETRKARAIVGAEESRLAKAAVTT